MSMRLSKRFVPSCDDLEGRDAASAIAGAVVDQLVPPQAPVQQDPNWFLIPDPAWGLQNDIPATDPAVKAGMQDYLFQITAPPGNGENGIGLTIWYIWPPPDTPIPGQFANPTGDVTDRLSNPAPTLTPQQIMGTQPLPTTLPFTPVQPVTNPLPLPQRASW